MGSQDLFYKLRTYYKYFKMPASVFQPYRVSQVGGRISPWKEEIEDLNESIETCSLSSDESSLTSDVSDQIKSETTDKYWPRRKKSLLIGGSGNMVVIPGDKIEKGSIFPRRPRSILIIQQ